MNPDKLEIEYLRTALDLEKKKVEGLNQIIERLIANSRQACDRQASAPVPASDTLPVTVAQPDAAR